MADKGTAKTILLHFYPPKIQVNPELHYKYNNKKSKSQVFLLNLQNPLKKGAENFHFLLHI